MSKAGAVRVALIGYGEVGRALASDLAPRLAAPPAAWDRLFREPHSGPSRTVRADGNAVAAASMAEAIGGRELVISAVTAGECLAAAREAAGALQPGAWYFDLNSVAPQTKREAAELIGAAGGRYIEAAVMSPIHPKRSAAPMLIGGPHAREFVPLAVELGFVGASFCSDRLGTAAASKMCRSVIIKGLEALLTEALLAARRYGVDEAVLNSLYDLLPAKDWPALARYMIARSVQHGIRRAEEMEQVALTVAGAGLEPWMSRATVERQRWAAEFQTALGAEMLGPFLDLMLEGIPQ
ncbi:MAG: DUF1932 domain-containing protein [Steroidobacteraceae bacterium]|nr:DUF1932 domain-containing protein [Steroidobacteraceae bacterium]MDW8258540.1 DUF1932 domain-containing protein [Gammaproteobacteria bacterium]